MKARRWIIPGLLLSFILVLTAAGVSSAETPFMSIDEIRAGMRGKGLTVIEGTAVRSFDVEVLGLTEGTGTVESFILVRVSGKALSDAGGIAAGMSGSPVYIGGKLAGAISYVFTNADPHYGLVTPIQSMLRLWDYEVPAGTASWGDGPLVVGGRPYRGVSFEPAGAAVLHAVPVKTPVVLRGFGPRARRMLSGTLDSWGGVVAPVGGPGTMRAEADEYELRPGSPLGVQLLRGDLDMTAVGTLTWVDGARFIGFGHPMAGQGPTDLLATRAYVQKIIPSSEAPFKLATPFAAFGTITQDRSAGIAGRLDRLPALLPIEVEALDAAGGRRVSLSCESVVRGDSTPTIAATVALEGLDRCLDRIGAGSARVTVTVQAGPALSMTRQNLFYHKRDIAAACVGELAEYLNFLLNNEFRRVDPTSVKLSAVVYDDPLTAAIIAARVGKERAVPGETVELVITVRPYRQAPKDLVVPIFIPADTPAGKLEITVRGGSRSSEPPDEESKDLPMVEGDSFDEALQNWIKRPHNNDIIIQIKLPADPETERENSNGRPEPLVKTIDYVIGGSKSASVEVVAPASNEGD